MKGSRELTLAVLLAVLMVGAAIVEPRFVSLHAQTLLATHAWELGIVALAMLFVIMAGGIDLSVGSMVALSAVTLGLLFERGVNPFAAAGAACLVGLGAGSLNGWLIARTRVHPLLITLASMAAFRGIAEGITMARPISGYPDSFLGVSSGMNPGILFLVLALIAFAVVSRTSFGRWVAAIGLDENVSRFSKIPVDRMKVALYGLSGLACGIAAVLFVARNNTAKADLGMGLELEAITAVVLGGARIEGGKGSVPGLVLALILIHETREFISWHWKQAELNLIVIGVLLIGAILLDRVVSSSGRVSRKMSA